MRCRPSVSPEGKAVVMDMRIDIRVQDIGSVVSGMVIMSVRCQYRRRNARFSWDKYKKARRAARHSRFSRI
jgi:hypothetical protein